MRAEGDGEATQLREMIGNDGGGDLIHSEAAVRLRDIHGHQAQIAGLFQQARVTSKCLASISSVAGSTSLRRNSEAVRAI